MSIPYPYLPPGRTILYVPETNEFVQEAKRVRDTESTETNHATGAVIVKSGTVVARGANQSRLKNKTLLQLHKTYCIRKLLHVPTGTKYWLCPGCATSKEHAERRAIADAKKHGVDTDGADMYLYGHWWACEPCWDALIAAGIKNLYLLEGSERLFHKAHSENIIGRGSAGV